MSRALALSLSLVLFAPGCATWQMVRAPRLAPCPGPLVSTRAIEGDFTSRHNARITSDSLDVALSLVVQKRDDRLLVVGFGVLGAKTFAVSQVGEDVSVESFAPRLAVPPQNILHDLHRVHFARQLERNGEVTVEVHRSPEGQAVTRIENRTCGYSARYVEVSQDRRP